MTNCIFCKIAEHKIPAKIVYEDDEVVAFHDTNPQAPVHLLVIPRKHISRISEMETEDIRLLGRLIFAAKQQAGKFGLANGYRLVFNNGRDGGQHVFHIHLHLLGGRPMHWPPG